MVTDILTNYLEVIRVKCSWWWSSESVDSEDDFCTGCQNVSHTNNTPSQDSTHLNNQNFPKVCLPGLKPFLVLILMVSYFFQFCCTAVLGNENKVDKQIKKGEML